MSSDQVYRLGGLSLLVGAVLSVISAVVSGIFFSDNSPQTATNPLNVLLSVVGVIGTALALLGLPAMYARSAREGGWLWLIGVVLIAITGMLFGIFMGLMGALVFPALASMAPTVFGEGPPPAFFVLFIVGTLANAVGALLMGIPMLTKRLYPRWCGYLMLAEVVLAVLGFVLNGPGNSLIGQVLNVLGPLPLFVVIGWAGYELWLGRGLPAEQPARTVAPQPA